MTQHEAVDLAQRIAGDVQRGLLEPVVILCDVYDDVPAADPERCPRLNLLWQARGEWYASVVHSEAEYVKFLQVAREMNAVAVSLN